MAGKISRLLYPRRCPVCSQVIPDDLLICPGCEGRLKKVKPPTCIRCGRHISDSEAEYCSECLDKGHSYSFGLAVFEYDALMKQSMSDFKFNGRVDNGEYFASEAVKLYRDSILRFAPDALVPVPIHASRRRRRGYNQSELLADYIGKKLGIPVIKDMLFRRKRTSFQKLLGKSSRAQNLSKAFGFNSGAYNINKINSRYKRVMIVDDIYTTGSTLESCSRTLLRNGVSEVGFICICIGRGY